MWLVPVLLGSLLGGAGYYAWEHRKRALLPAGAGPATLSLLPGALYAVTVYAARGTTPDKLNEALAKAGMRSSQRLPAKAADDVKGTGYTFAPNVDQWLAYVVTDKPLTLPIILTPDGKDVVGVAKSASQLKG